LQRTTRATSAAVAASVQQEVTCEICYLALPATVRTMYKIVMLVSLGALACITTGWR